MADNYLITGYCGEPHVTAENDRGINAAMFGTGRFVLPVGEQFKAEYIGNNTIRMFDGKLMDNGAAAGIPAGEYIDLLISSAGQGMKRNDLIVFQYSQDSSTLVERGTFVVIQGTETSGTASDPALTQEDLLSGEAVFDQMALWRVPVAGTTISAPVKLFSVSTDLPSLKTWAEGAFAPSGYGLGETSGRWVNDLNTAIKPGFYSPGGDSAVNYPANNSLLRYGTLLVERRNNHIIQTLNYKHESAKRYSDDGGSTWEAWEHITPPMQSGVEYRTAKRYNGNPVYTKLIDFGTLPNATSSNITIDVEWDKVIDIRGVAKSTSGCVTHFFPKGNSSAGIDAYVYAAYPQKLWVIAKANLSAYTANFVIEYTK